MANFEELLNQIDAFIRKFYKNQMIKGILLFLIIFLFTFLMVTGLEYIGRFNSFVRAVLLFSFIGLNAVVLFSYFVIPLLKLLSFGKRIDKYQAATIIGRFFPSIDDKLLNTLQLQDASQAQPKNIEFLKASIQQNAEQLNAFTFTSAIDYSTNKRFLKYFFPILMTVVLIGVAYPSFFSEGSQRLIQYNQIFERTPDFTFELQNSDLIVEEGEPLEIVVVLKPLPGKALPDKIYIESSEGNFLMKKDANNKASYTFNNLRNDVQFIFRAVDAHSKSHHIKVIKRTSLGHLKVDIVYPAYLNQANETIDNPGDLIVPNGTKLIWNGLTKNAKKLNIVLADSTLEFKSSGFRFEQKVFNTTEIAFVLENNEILKHDTVSFHIDVIKDEYPSILVESRTDSLSPNKIYFTGAVSDDYGLSQLIFTYTIEKANGQKISKDVIVPGIDGRQSPFSMTFNKDELSLELKDKLIYFFTVYDNDGVNGSKSTRSNIFVYNTPSLEELQEQRGNQKEKTTEDLKELIRESAELNEEISRLKKELLNTKSPSWQQQQQLKNLQKQLEQLQQRMQESKDQMKSSFEEKAKLDPQDERLLELQQQLEEMFDALMDDELKDLLDELQKMMEQNMTEDMLEKLEESEMSSEEMERQLDRTLEMLKKMDVEERIKDLQNSLESLSKEQDELRENLEELSKEEGQKKQEKLNEKFDKMQDQMDKLLEKNDDLKRPLTLDGLDDLMDDISKDMKDAKENIDKENSKGAKEKQESASDKMQQAASQMQAQMKASQEDQNEEDYESLRALLENLVRLSFDQENNMLAYRGTDIFDPYFVTLGMQQRGIIDNLAPIKDSLRALSSRIPQISSFVEQELSAIEKQYRYIPEHIGEREKPELLAKQQFAMTSINNLALFLNEAMEAAQQGMQSGEGEGEGDEDGEGEGGEGEGSPGKGKPGKKGQGGEGDLEGIKDALKKQLEQMKNGNQLGGQKPGSNSPGGLLPMNSQQAAKMAAEQSAIKQKLQQLREHLNKDGSGDGNKLNEVIKELEKQQEDLINKNWQIDLLDRQQEILTRLLESENAMRERDWDEERESNSGKDQNKGNQIEFIEYKKQKEKQIELLRTLDPSFSKYYKEKANAYFLNVQ